MELNKFLNLLKRNRYVILTAPIIVVIITYFLTRNLPNVYSSRAKLATGIVDQTQKVLADGSDAQESKISQEFANLIEMIKSKKILDQVSYYLIIHDLTNKTPYRQPSKLFKQLNDSARKHALETYKELYEKREPLSLTNPDQNGLYSLLTSMGYDDLSLSRNMAVYRVQNTDYINMQFDSERPDLSANIVNTVCNDFIEYYTYLIKENQRKAIGFWGNLLKANEDTLNKRMAELKAYKIHNHILNLNEKAKSVYGQISDFESRRQDIEKTVRSTKATIDSINKKFDSKDRMYSENSTLKTNQVILQERAELARLNDEYFDKKFDPSYKVKIDSLSGQLATNIQKLSGDYILSPLNVKKDLMQQKITLQVQNDLAENSVKTIAKELKRLKDEFDSLVPHEGTIQAYESAISVASQEYLGTLAKYNQALVDARWNIQLKVTEVAQPGQPQPSKKTLLVGLSGIVSFILCIAIFFIIYFFDNTIKNASDLANKTKLPVLGYVNLLKGELLDLRKTWTNSAHLDEINHFKDLMQSLRYEVTNELGDYNVLLINSALKGEGKTFIAINLAYAFSTINKKVLLIDGNFSTSGISDFAKKAFYLEDFLNDSIDPIFFKENYPIHILCNQGGDNSLFEISKADNIRLKFKYLVSMFDVIIIESSALETLNKSKEWVSFADKIITVFESGQKVTYKTKQHIEYLKSLDGKFAGWILNMVYPNSK